MNPNKEPDPLENKQALVDYVLSNITKLSNSANSGDERQLIMLVAAISLLNLGDTPKIISAARRIAQMSTIKAKK